MQHLAQQHLTLSTIITTTTPHPFNHYHHNNISTSHHLSPLHAPIPYIHSSSVSPKCRTCAAVRHRVDDITVVYRLVVCMVSSHIRCPQPSKTRLCVRCIRLTLHSLCQRSQRVHSALYAPSRRRRPSYRVLYLRRDTLSSYRLQYYSPASCSHSHYACAKTLGMFLREIQQQSSVCFVRC